MKSEKVIILFSGWLFVFFCFFPYVSLLGLNTTTQPNALFFALFPIVFIRSRKLPVELFLFGIVLCFATFFLMTSNFSFLFFRDWANYLSLVVVSLGAYKFLRYINGLPYKFFYLVVTVWFLVGMIQTLLFPEFLSFLVHNMRGANVAGRGVTSLSGEPTYYGLMLGLFFVVYLINNWHKRSRLLGFLILFQMIFLSKATTVIIIFILTIGIFIFISMLRFNIKLIFTVSALVITTSIFMVLTIDLYKDLRIYKISQIVLDHPETILAVDLSVSERVNHVVFPIIGLIEGGGLPRGYGKFSAYLLSKNRSGNYKAFFSHPLTRGSSRILSGHGKVFFEMGGIGLLVSIGIFAAFRFGFSNPPFLFGFTFYFLLLFAALPFMTATVPFIIGNSLFLRHSNSLRKKNSY